MKRLGKDKEFILVNFNTDQTDNIEKITKGDSLLTEILISSLLKIILFKVKGIKNYTSYLENSGEKSAVDSNHIDSKKSIREIIINEREKLLNSSKSFKKNSVQPEDTQEIYIKFFTSYTSEHEDFYRDNEQEAAIQLYYKEDKLVFQIYSKTDALSRYSQYGHLLKTIVSKLPTILETPIKEVPLITEKEKKKINEISHGEKLVPKFPTFLHAFHDAVKKYPNKKVLFSEDWTLTYKELDETSNRLSNYIIEAFGKNKQIPLLMSNSPITFIAVLGILKSGSAFLPIDPAYPLERIEYIIEQSLFNGLFITDTRNISISKMFKQYDVGALLAKNKTSEIKNLQLTFPKQEEIAYVIFTSGTTGNPKGVKVSHRALMNLITWHNHQFSIENNWIAARYAGAAFDASIWELFPYLSIGASVYVVSPSVRYDVKKINAAFIKNRVTIAFLPTAVFEAFTKLKNPYLKTLLTGADKLQTYTKQKYEQYNNYGPTEYTVVATTFQLDGEYQNIPIGRPVANTEALVVSYDGNLLPLGMEGELFLGGESLSSGYLNDQIKTEESFVRLSGFGNRCYYRTGDWVSYDSAGNLLYLGRMDNQIKIRGYRVEIQDIENNILEALGEGSKNSVVVLPVESDGILSLHAFYTGIKEQNFDSIIEKLTDRLPDYMIPNTIEYLSEFPLTPNGKINREELKSNVISHFNSLEEEPVDNLLVSDVLNVISEVLGGRKIKANEDFFYSGGNSLSAAELANKLQDTQRVRIEINDIFELRTAVKIADYLVSKEKDQWMLNNNFEEKKEYKAAGNQKSIFIEQQIDTKSLAYNMPIVYELTGKINVEKLQLVLAKIVEENAVLRSVYSLKNEEVIVSEQTLENSIVIVREITSDKFDLNKEFQRFVKPFDLGKDILLRGELIKTQAKKYFFLDTHHIAFDGGSLNPFIQQIEQLYKDETISTISYQEYAYYISTLSSNEESQIHFEKTFVEPILPIEFSDIGIKDVSQNRVSMELNNDFSARIKQHSKEKGVTIFTFLFALIGYVLSKYSNEKKIYIGVPVSNRADSKFKDTLGMFVNTLPIQTDYTDVLTAEMMVQKISDIFQQSLKHKYFTLEEITRIYRNANPGSSENLFNIMFVMNEIDSFDFQTDEIGFTHVQIENQCKEVKYDLSIEVNDTKNSLEIAIEYNNQKYSSDFSERILKSFIESIEELVLNHKSNLSDVDVVFSEEKELIHSFLTTKTYEGNQMKLHEPFERLVKKMPNKVVVKDKNHSLTAKELDDKANIIGNFLIKKGIETNQRVGVILNRSIDMMAALFGILKAGGTYVPIEPSAPVERLEYILNNSRCEFVLHEKDLYSGNIDNQTIEKIYSSAPDTTRVESTAANKDLCYIIYTSGTTGNPKGVMISHESVMNRLLWMNEAYPVTNQDVVLQKTSFSFDVSIWELFGWTINGAVLYFLENGEEKDPQKIIETINQEKISKLHFVPSMLNMFLEFCLMGDRKELVSVNTIFSSGEALTQDQVIRFYKTFDKENTKLINMYGPTETTVEVTAYNCGELNGAVNVPIGKPLCNVEAYVLDDQKQLSPIGVVGELYIGGVQVAQGYVNNQELTDKMFVKIPKLSESTLYRTGDLVKWTKEGTLEIVGRADNQIKIRGFRVELSDIENNLKVITQKNCIVDISYNSNGEKSIVSFIESNLPVDELEIKEQMKTLVPEYMIPVSISKIAEFPLNTSGKIDRKKILSMSAALENKEQSEQPLPKSVDLETDLKDLWSEILNLSKEKFSSDESFFSLGGDSIKAIGLASKIISMGYKISVKDIFKNPTINQLIQMVDQLVEEDFSEQTGIISETPITKWFWNQKFQHPNHWNQGVVLKSMKGFDDQLVQSVMEQIIRDHAMLNSRLTTENMLQCHSEHPKESYTYHVIDVSDWGEDIQKIMDNHIYNVLSSSNKMVHVIRFICEGFEKLVFSIHHLIVDAVSWRIILEDFCDYYLQYEQKNEVKIKAKTDTYLTWAKKLVALNDQFAESHLEIKYWQKIEESWADSITEQVAVSGTVKDRKQLRKVLDQETSQALLKRVSDNENISFEHLLITLLLISLNKSTKISDVLLLMENHGREEILTQTNLARTVGWFTTMYPQMFHVKNSLMDTLLGVKDSMNRVPHKGIGHGLINLVKEQNKWVKKPEISFNFLGEIQQNFNSDHIVIDNQELGCLVHKSNQNSQALDFSLFLSEGQLYFDIYFDCQRISPELAEKIMNTFEAETREAIKLPLKNEETISISDLTVENFEYEENFSIQRFVNVDKIRKVLPMQNNVLFIEQSNHGQDIYHEQFRIDMEGTLNNTLFLKALEMIVNKFEALRTKFDLYSFGEPVQIILKNYQIELNTYDFSDDRTFCTAQLNKRMIDHRDRAFDLSTAELFKIEAVNFAGKETTILIDYHHIILDGWSMLVILKELFACYAMLTNNEPVTLGFQSNLDDYYQYRHLFKADSAKEHWNKYLANLDGTVKLEDFSVKEVKTGTEEKEILIPLGEYARIKDFCKENEKTMNDFAHLLWSITMHKYLQSETKIFGYTVSGRSEDIDMAREAGLFINTIPQVTTVKEETSIYDLFEDIHKNIANNHEYAQLPLSEILKETQIDSESINTLLVYENFPGMERELEKNLELSGLVLQNYQAIEKTSYDLTLIFSEDNGLSIRLMYNLEKFSEGFISVLAANLKNLIVEVIEADFVYELKVTDKNHEQASHYYVDIEDIQEMEEKLSFEF